jgi:hypothetical protein
VIACITKLEVTRPSCIDMRGPYVLNILATRMSVPYRLSQEGRRGRQVEGIQEGAIGCYL